MTDLNKPRLLEARVKCLHCGVIFAPPQGSQQRFCDTCEATKPAPRARTEVVVCEHCQGRGRYYRKIEHLGDEAPAAPKDKRGAK